MLSWSVYALAFLLVVCVWWYFAVFKNSRAVAAGPVHGVEQQATDVQTAEEEHADVPQVESEEVPSEDTVDRTPPHPDFPQVIITDQGNLDRGPVQIYANTRRPIRVKNKNFEGHLIMMLKSDPIDPFFADHFKGKKRCVEFRLQGKFLRQPRGPIFFGGEVSRPMSLGLVLGPLARLMLSLISSLTKGIFHASFATECPDERPHICTSFFAGVDQLVISKPGDPLPDIMQPLGETKEQRKIRQTSPEPTVDTNNTYSFSFHDMHFDLLKWKVVNLVKEMDLHSFWEDQPFRFVAYDVGGTPEIHRDQDKDYFFCFQFKHIIGARPERIEWPDSDSDDGQGGYRSSGDEEEAVRTTSLRIRERLSSMDKVDQACSIPAWLEYSDNRTKRVAFVLLVSATKGKSRFVVKTVKELRAFWPELDGKLKDEIKSLVNSASMGRDTSKSHKVAYFEKQRRALDMAFRNIPGSSRKNKSALNAFVKDRITGLEHVILRPSVDKPRFKVISSRSAAAAGNIFIEGPVLFAEWESFWREGWATISKVGSGGARRNPAKDEHDAGAHPNMNFELSFYRLHSSKPFAKVSCSSIIGAQLLHSNASIPFPTRCDCCFEVKTFGRSYLFLVASPQLAMEWVDVLQYTSEKCKKIQSHGTERSAKSGGSHSTQYSSSLHDLGTTDIFNIKSLRWDPTTKVLNGRRLCFPHNVPGKGESSGTPESAGSDDWGIINRSVGLGIDPCVLSARLVRVALSVSPENAIKDDLESDRFRNLLDLGCQLKDIDYQLLLEPDVDLRQTKLVVFWTNIYHAIMLHGQLMFGKSKSVFASSASMKNIKYEIFREPYRHTYSMVEIEHCILRARMSRPETSKLLMSLFPTFDASNPKWDFALPLPEGRINFALNSGLASCLDKVPVFTVGKLDSQLNRVCEAYLQESVTIDKRKRLVKLPKLCEWYKKDLASDGRPTSILAAVGELMGSHGHEFREFIESPGSLTIQYHSFQWTSLTTPLRPMWKEDPEEHIVF